MNNKNFFSIQSEYGGYWSETIYYHPAKTREQFETDMKSLIISGAHSMIEKWSQKIFDEETPFPSMSAITDEAFRPSNMEKLGYTRAEADTEYYAHDNSFDDNVELLGQDLVDKLNAVHKKWME